MREREVAMQVAEIFEVIVGADSGIGIRAYDGSTAGDVGGGNVLDVKSQEALQYLATAPSDLGMARAFITGAIDVEGDLATVIRAIALNNLAALPLSDKLALARSIGLSNLRRPPVPAEESRVRGLRHSKRRDAQAISHHYDVSNTFYRMLLGPSMAYTCAVFPTPDSSLDEAQTFKFDLVCRKLDLRPGMRLLDVGCGWGGMVMHAVKNYGVEAVGVTLSRPQAEYGAKQLAEAGLTDRAEIRYGDYRDIAKTSQASRIPRPTSEPDATNSAPCVMGIAYRSQPPSPLRKLPRIPSITSIQTSINVSPRAWLRVMTTRANTKTP